MKIKKLTSVFLGILLLSSVTSSLRPIHAQSSPEGNKEDTKKFETWRSIPKNWPERIKKSPYLKNDPRYGIFICLDGSNPLWVKQSETDPMIPAEVKTKHTCPKGAVLIRTVKPVWLPPNRYGFACVVAPNPEDLSPIRKPSPPIDAKTGLPVSVPPEKPICEYLTVGVDIMVDIDYDTLNKIKSVGPPPPVNSDEIERKKK
jgi:hypothetical protein